MRDAQPQAILLADYTEPAYWIDETELTFTLNDEYTDVLARLRLRANDAADTQGVLALHGQSLTLLSVVVDGQVRSANDYRVDDDFLYLTELSQHPVLEIVTRIYPAQNTALEGLYRSGGMYCTQCEAEGFRRITYYLDRPDVMSVFTTHIMADAQRFPTMLSNGNCIADECEGDLRHVTWHDPHKKPSYLFALVVGDLVMQQDTFVTVSGRTVALQIFVEPQNADKTDYALDALKRAMRWDEDVYGREYDLDVFMIVAVDDFNMGAMENKGLNIFNSSCVLANPSTATDAAYQRIEAIVAHEYFHNWSGNRVTCRDWFQLSLKEGFTVFRDACFSADMNSATVKRIEDARIMRTVQFAEDAGPMAHPVQPDSFIEISNFYTVTIYEKGAEIVRMLHKILGADGFRQGSDLYFARHDGQAVTIDDFLAAMEAANRCDLSVFRRWYKQAGTPQVAVSTHYDEGAQQFHLTLRQASATPAGQAHHQPLWIPVQLGLLDRQGRQMPITLDCTASWNSSSQVLHFSQTEQTFVFEGVYEQPIVSLFRDFSAPVKVDFAQTADELLFLWQHDSDGFNRWDAGQRLMLQWIQEATHKECTLSQEAIQALRGILHDESLDPVLVTYLMTLPSEAYIAEFSAVIDPAAIHHARLRVKYALARALVADMARVYQRLNTTEAYAAEPQQMARRTLKNLALHYWLLADPLALAAVQIQLQQADNMTDKMAALAIVLESGDTSAIEQNLMAFYQQWQHDPLVVNPWLALQASSATLATVEYIEKLLHHEAFDWRNPNKVRSVLGAFSQQALVQFHAQDGSGYRLLADAVIRLNASNPQIAARLLAPLTKYRRLIPALAVNMKQELERIMQTPELSKDVYEVVSKSLV